MNKLSYCDKTPNKKYSVRYQKSLSLEEPAKIIDEISKIRINTLKKLILLKIAYSEQIKSNFTVYSSKIHSIDFVKEVLGCNTATAYDYLKTLVAISVLSDKELDIMRSLLRGI